MDCKIFLVDLDAQALFPLDAHSSGFLSGVHLGRVIACNDKAAEKTCHTDTGGQNNNIGAQNVDKLLLFFHNGSFFFLSGWYVKYSFVAL